MLHKKKYLTLRDRHLYQNCCKSILWYLLQYLLQDSHCNNQSLKLILNLEPNNSSVAMECNGNIHDINNTFPS